MIERMQQAKLERDAKRVAAEKEERRQKQM